MMVTSDLDDEYESSHSHHAMVIHHDPVVGMCHSVQSLQQQEHYHGMQQQISSPSSHHRQQRIAGSPSVTSTDAYYHVSSLEKTLETVLEMQRLGQVHKDASSWEGVVRSSLFACSWPKTTADVDDDDDDDDDDESSSHRAHCASLSLLSNPSSQPFPSSSSSSSSTPSYF
jgi:hypothetical protein